MNWRVFNGKIGKNYAWDLEFLYKYRDFSDGIDFLVFDVSWDRYECDHKPSFEIAFKILNFIMIELTIYNIWHMDNPNSPHYSVEGDMDNGQNR
jgi:hypothetical protein